MQAEPIGPNFLCVGMPKCGTSTLHAVLENYSDVYVCPVKELKFFAADKIGYRGSARELLFADHWAAKQERLAVGRIIRGALKGQGRIKDLTWAARFVFGSRDINRYQSLFPQDRISGDISPAYHMLEQDEIAAIAERFPHLRIVIMLRNPYHQMWSHCRMSARGKSPEDELKFFQEQVDYQLGLCPSYLGLITRWSACFGADNVLVEYLEDMSTDTATVARRVLSFVDPAGKAATQLETMNSDYRVFAGGNLKMPAGVHDILMDASRARLTGYEAVDAGWADRWNQELHDIDTAQRQQGDTPEAT